MMEWGLEKAESTGKAESKLVRWIFWQQTEHIKLYSDRIVIDSPFCPMTTTKLQSHLLSPHDYDSRVQFGVCMPLTLPRL